MAEVSQLEGLRLLEARDPDLYQLVTTMPAQWFVDRQGVAHGRPSHAGEGSVERQGAVAEVLQEDVCTSQWCTSVYRLAGADALLIARKGQLLAELTAQAALLPAVMEDNPREALLKCRELRARLLITCSEDSWALGDSLLAELERLGEAARTKLLTEQQRDRDREWAGAEYLKVTDLGPLHDLRMLAASVLGSPQEELHSLLAECDGSVEWSQQLEAYILAVPARSTCPTLETLPLLDPYTLQETLSATNSPSKSLHTAWQERAIRAARNVPQWWQGAMEHVLSTDLAAIALLGTGELREGSEERWEAYRVSPDSPLCLLPYSAGRLLEATRGTVVCVVAAPLSSSALEICRTLIHDADTITTARQLEETLTAAVLLAEDTPKVSGAPQSLRV